MDCIYTSDGYLEKNRRTRELGSVLRLNDDYNENGVRPRWTWITPLFGGAALLSAWNADRQPFDTLICNVHRDNPSTAARIVGDAYVEGQTRYGGCARTPPRHYCKRIVTRRAMTTSIFQQIFSGHLSIIYQRLRSTSEVRPKRQVRKFTGITALLQISIKTRVELDLSHLPSGMLRMMELISEYPSIFKNMGRINMSWSDALHQLDPLLGEKPSDPYNVRFGSSQNPSNGHGPRKSSRSGNGNGNGSGNSNGNDNGNGHLTSDPIRPASANSNGTPPHKDIALRA